MAPGPAIGSVSVIASPDHSTLNIRVELAPGVLLSAAPEPTKPLSAVLSRLQSKLQKVHKRLKSPAPALQLQDVDGVPIDLSMPVGQLREVSLATLSGTALVLNAL